MFAQQQRTCDALRAEMLYSGQSVRVSESEVDAAEAGDSSGTQSRRNVRRLEAATEQRLGKTEKTLCMSHLECVTQ
jgi:hypothetical protein